MNSVTGIWEGKTVNILSAAAPLPVIAPDPLRVSALTVYYGGGVQSSYMWLGDMYTKRMTKNQRERARTRMWGYGYKQPHAPRQSCLFPVYYNVSVGILAISVLQQMFQSADFQFRNHSPKIIAQRFRASFR